MLLATSFDTLGHGSMLCAQVTAVTVKVSSERCVHREQTLPITYNNLCCPGDVPMSPGRLKYPKQPVRRPDGWKMPNG